MGATHNEAYLACRDGGTGHLDSGSGDATVNPGPCAGRDDQAMVDIVVATSRKGITVDGFGACSPTPCEFGRIAGTAFGPNVSATIGTSFAAQWNFKFKRTVLLARYSAPKRVPTLTVNELNTFTDGSGRANFTVTETFRPTVVATTGGTFLAPYTFGFANKLLDGSINAAGTR